MKEILPLRDIKALSDIYEKLTVTGAGLPKEHVVHSDDSSEQVVLNREQQARLRFTSTALTRAI